MNRYDAVFILNDRKFEDNGQAFEEKIKALVAELGGANVEAKNYGRLRFARTVQKKNTGLYVRFFFDLDADKVKEFQDKFRLDESIIRVVVFKYEVPAGEVRTLQLDQ